MLKSLKGVDLFRKVTQDYQQSTALGGILSLISVITMLFLLSAEVYSFNYSPAKPKLIIEPHSDLDYMNLLVNISFSNSPCNSLVTFTTDSLKEHYKFYSLKRTVLDSSGNPVFTEPHFEINDVHQVDCGSCYGAESDWRKCCNSCGEVMEAYGNKKWKPPQFSDIEQCQKFVSGESDKGPGCRMEGVLQVKKIPGNVHFKNTLNLDRRNAFFYSAAHRIEKFLFVDPVAGSYEYPGPLDGTKVDSGFIISYYMKLMPAIRESGKYFESSTNNLVFERVTNPEVIFSYDIEPITTKYNRDKSFLGFIVNCCAIVGGWFAITVFVSRIIIK